MATQIAPIKKTETAKEKIQPAAKIAKPTEEKSEPELTEKEPQPEESPDEDLKKAKALYRENRLDEALVKYKRVAQRWPNNVEAHTGIARIYHDLGRYEEAELWYLKTDEIDQTVAGAKIRRDLIRLRASHLNYLLSVEEQDFALDRSNVQEYDFLGRIYPWEEKHDESILVYKKAIEKDPENLSLITGLAQTNYFSGDFDNSIEQYNKALRISPDSFYAIKGINQAFSAKAPSVTTEYRYYSFEGEHDDFSDSPRHRDVRHEIVAKSKIYLKKKSYFQLKGHYAFQDSEDVSGLGREYRFREIGGGPRLDYQFTDWLTSSAQYILKSYKDYSKTTDILSLFNSPVFHSGYGLLRATIGPIFISPGFARHPFVERDFSAGVAQIKGFSDYIAALGVYLGEYVEIISSYTHRDFDQTWRGERELFDFQTKIRLPFYQWLELGYGFFWADNPNQRIQRGSLRFQHELNDELSIDVIGAGSIDPKFNPSRDVYKAEGNLFISWKFDPRFRLNFDGLISYESNGDHDFQQQYFTYLTMLLGKISVH
ncbi:tetratricopeptide repeat protein [Bdellovibrionota bacterium]